MKFALHLAAIFLLCLQSWIVTTNAAACPKHCTQEAGANKKVICNCCRPGDIPIDSPCDMASCAMWGICVNVECEGCGDGVSLRCKSSDCGDEPSTCPDGHLLVRNLTDCKFCKPVKEDIIDPCSDPKACNPGEECVRRDVQCVAPSCHPLKECYKTDCPPVKCPTGCYQYEKKDGCGACKCCRYELE